MPIVTISTALRAISEEKQGSRQRTLTALTPSTGQKRMIACWHPCGIVYESYMLRCRDSTGRHRERLYRTRTGRAESEQNCSHGELTTAEAMRCGSPRSKPNARETTAHTASAEVGAGQAKSAVYISRSRARMTVLADHGAPLGVSTWRAFNSAATARADLSVKWEQFRLAASYVDRILRGPEPRGKCQNCQTEDYPQG
jgi:hypothetical protein